MSEPDKILDVESQIKGNKTKRNSCLLITAVIILLLLAFAYVASKEVANAFQLVDKGLASTTKTFEQSNEALKNALLKTREYKPIVEKIESTSFRFNTLIDSTINQLVIQTGGWKVGTNKLEFSNPKNYEIPTRIMISEKVGDKIERVIKQTNLNYIGILKDELTVDTIEIPLKLNYEFKEKHDKTWSEMNFDHMPLFALMPLLRKFKNDESESKAIIYRYMASQ